MEVKNRAFDGAVLFCSGEAFFIGPVTAAGVRQRGFHGFCKLAPPTGFEPVISALKGQRPNR
jgi:hypothetical protein